MAKPSRFSSLTRNITRDVLEHPKDLTKFYSTREGITRAAAARYVLQLEREGWIARSGPPTRPVFSPGYRRRVSQQYKLAKLEEDVIWSNDFRPFFNLAGNVANIVAHGFTEMVNNSIDHSAGTSVFVAASQNEQTITLAVADNGIGIFEKISKALNLPDKRQALFELSKGKFTTDPSRHSGEGVFFTSRMFDFFEIDANGLQFSHDDTSKRDWLLEEPSPFRDGTIVFMKIALNSTRTTADVFNQFMNAPEDFDFSKTIVPMKLARLGDEQLISRSQAKRLIARFDRFKIVILDFKGVNEVGQAFADELFRVYATAHPQVEITPINMTEQVERMWMRAVSPRME
jgi:anti-sigma regulatory factor (Ser/Thr protein kinase)